MLTIHLSNLSFHGFHGLYEEEKIIGGDFLVDADIDMDEPLSLIKSLHQSLNYVEVYECIKKSMDHPTPLIETIAMEIAENILSLSLSIQNVKITIKKVSPPIINFIGQVGISYSKSRASLPLGS